MHIQTCRLFMQTNISEDALSHSHCLLTTICLYAIFNSFQVERQILQFICIILPVSVIQMSVWQTWRPTIWATFSEKLSRKDVLSVILFSAVWRIQKWKDCSSQIPAFMFVQVSYRIAKIT